MTRRLPLLLLIAAATAARADAAWRPEEPLALWQDAPVAEAGTNVRTNALGAAFCADTGLVPAAGPFTASALLRVDGFAAMPERMEWRNGMALCCSSGYYDGFRLLLHDTSEFRPVFEIVVRPEPQLAAQRQSAAARLAQRSSQKEIIQRHLQEALPKEGLPSVAAAKEGGRHV